MVHFVLIYPIYFNNINNFWTGEHYLELINYYQVILFNAGTLGINSEHKEIYCNYGCESINHSVMEKLLEIQIHDCHTVGMVQDIQSCPAVSAQIKQS